MVGFGEGPSGGLGGFLEADTPVAPDVATVISREVICWFSVRARSLRHLDRRLELVHDDDATKQQHHWLNATGQHLRDGYCVRRLLALSDRSHLGGDERDRRATDAIVGAPQGKPLDRIRAEWRLAPVRKRRRR